MFALFLTAVSALAAIAAVALLVDGGLRWWSAFGRLRGELKGSRIVEEQVRAVTRARLRPSFVASRSATTRKSAGVPVTRAVA